MLAVPGLRTALLGGPFNPRQLSGLALWLDASQSSSLITDGAVQLTAASSQSLSINDNATLSTGDLDYWMAGWFYQDSAGAGSFPTFIGKWGAAGNREYIVFYDQAANRMKFSVSPDGTVNTNLVTASTFGAVSSSAWHFVVAYHDAVTDKLGISVDGGAFDTTSYALGSFDSAAAFQIGGAVSGSVYWTGRIDSVAFGKSPVGGIASLATTIRDALYNSGTGRVYADLTSAQKTAWGLVSWWNLNEVSGTRNDAHGTNNLTANNTPTLAAGVASGFAGDSDPITQWQDQSGLGNHASQATATKRPVLKLTAGINGNPSDKSDGVDDTLACATLTKSQIPTTGDVTMAVVFQLTALGSQSLIYLGNANAFAPNDHFVGIQYVLNLGLVFNNYDGTEHRAVSDAALVAGTPYVAVGVRESNVNKLYLNGVLQATQPASGTPNVSASATLGLASNQGVQVFSGGYISDAVVVPSALNASAAVRLSRYLGQRRGIAVS